MSAEAGLDVVRLARGFWSWRVGREPASWYVETPDAVLVVDPLAPPPGSPAAERFWRHLDVDVQRMRLPVEVVVLTPAQPRDAALVQRRYGDLARVRGAPEVESRLPAGVRFAPIAAGGELAAGVMAVAVDGGLALRLTEIGATIPRDLPTPTPRR